MIDYRTIWECHPATFHKELELAFADGWEPMPETLTVHLSAKTGTGFFGFIILRRSEGRAAAFEGE